jgi:ribose/xylose/arabinose/galactoside ABC-type transport system permease subunit
MVAFSSTTCALILVLFAQPTDTRLVTVSGFGVFCSIVGAVLAGFFIGTLHTWLITAIRLPPFVATLATLVGLRSFARAMCEFVTLQRRGSQNQLINVNTPFFQFVKEHGVWLSMGTFIALAILTWLILSRTVLGRHLYALGGNEQAARLSGIRTENVKWFAYCYGAMTAAIAGIFMMADVSMAQPVNQAMGMELNAIAAAVVGGCSLQGGIGSVTGTVLGALFLRLVIDSVAKLFKAGADVYEGMIVGVVVVLAVTFTQFRQYRASGGGFFAGVRGLFAIPTLALGVGMLAMMGSVNVPLFKGRSLLVGLVVGIVSLLILMISRFLEQQRQTRID